MDLSAFSADLVHVTAAARIRNSLYWNSVQNKWYSSLNQRDGHDTGASLLENRIFKILDVHINVELNEIHIKDWVYGNQIWEVLWKFLPQFQ